MDSIYSEMLQIVRHTESVGLDSVWASEHHFADDSYLPSIMTTLGGIATITDDIQIGSSMALAPLYNPVRLAEDAATVELLSAGRLTLGIANGYRDVEFENFGIDKRERAARTEEAIRILRGAWSPGPLDYEPLFADVSRETVITPEPERSVPIIVGGVAKAAIRRAALMADGWVAPEKMSLDDIYKRQRYIERLRDVEKKNDDFTVYVQQYCFVADSTEKAWTAMKDGLFYVQRKYDEWIEGEEIEELSRSRKRELKEQAIFGTPEEVVDQLTAYRDTLGDDTHMILRTYLPGIETEEMLNSIEYIGDAVAPRVA